MINKFYSDVLDRVNEALIYRGYETEHERAMELAEMMNTTKRTALCWVRGQHFPRRWVTFIRLMQEKNRICFNWLSTGEGLMTLEEVQVQQFKEGGITFH